VLLDVGGPLASLPFGSLATSSKCDILRRVRREAARLEQTGGAEAITDKWNSLMRGAMSHVNRLSLTELLSGRCGDLTRYESELSLQLFQWRGGSEGVHTDDTA